MSDDRRRIPAALERREPRPVPHDFAFPPPARQRLEAHYRTRGLESCRARLLDPR